MKYSLKISVAKPTKHVGSYKTQEGAEKKNNVRFGKTEGDWDRPNSELSSGDHGEQGLNCCTKSGPRFPSKVNAFLLRTHPKCPAFLRPGALSFSSFLLVPLGPAHPLSSGPSVPGPLRPPQAAPCGSLQVDLAESVQSLPSLHFVYGYSV